MTEPSPAEELTAAIQVRARAVLEATASAEALAALDFEQFAIGSYYGSGAAMMILLERGMIRERP